MKSMKIGLSVKSYLLGWLILNCLAFPVIASDAVEQLKTFTKQVKSAEGEFVQLQVSAKNIADGKNKLGRQTVGKFTFVRPGKFVWETQKPFEQLLIADGKQLLMWDKDLNQATYRPANQALASTPAAILFGDSALDQFFNINPLEDKAGMSWVELTPKAGKGSSDDIPYGKISIGMQNDQPQAMELQDAFGNVVTLTFSKIKTNVAVPASKFNFVPPKGAEVVRMK
jgi:outer membrane lipoprotein carrier protein